MQNIFKMILLSVIILLTLSCSESTSSSSAGGLEKVSDYQGSWFQNGTSGTQKTTKNLNIASDFSYSKTENHYETTAKLVLSYTTVGFCEITAIMIDENNSEYETIFINVLTNDITPKTTAQAAQWNDDIYGGHTDWIKDQTKTFNSDHPGYWEFGSIWLHHVAVSVKREGDLLNVNERGGFDGFDPPEDVYFLQ